MSHGIIIYNDTGGVQMNTDDPLFVLASSGVVTASGNEAIIPNAPGNTEALIFVRSTGWVCITQFWFYGYLRLQTQYPTQSVTYKTFAPAHQYTPPSSGMGFKIIGADGRLVMSSAHLPLNLAYAGSVVRSNTPFTVTHGITNGLTLVNPFTPSKAIWDEMSDPFGTTDYYALTLNFPSSTQVSGVHRVSWTIPGNSTRDDPYGGTVTPILVIAP